MVHCFEFRPPTSMLRARKFLKFPMPFAKPWMLRRFAAWKFLCFTTWNVLQIKTLLIHCTPLSTAFLHILSSAPTLSICNIKLSLARIQPEDGYCGGQAQAKSIYTCSGIVLAQDLHTFVRLYSCHITPSNFKNKKGHVTHVMVYHFNSYIYIYS